jgi:hypothetical protein
MKKVTLSEMETILANKTFVAGMPIFASVLQYVSARLNKKNNQYADAMKFSKVSILLNSDYVKAVENVLVKEGKDKSDYKKGKNTMPIVKCDANNFFGYYEGKAVLEYRPNDNSRPNTKYMFNGKIIDKAKIADFIPQTKKAENQGTDREILWRKLYLSNVRKLSLDGEIYKIVAEPTQS